jgi:hypothetical protein
MKFRMLLILALALMAARFGLYAAPLGTAFTYQGVLTDSGPPANGFYDLRFGLFNTNAGPGQVGPLLTNSFTVVSNGTFTVTLDFGTNTFDGTAYWIELGARNYGSATDFTTFSPRLPLLPSPNALYAGVAGSVAANAVGGAGLQDGAITAAKIAGGQVVKSLNGLSDNVTLAPGANIALTTVGANTLQIAVTGPGNSWNLTGNSVTASGNFLGTVNNQPLEMRVNGLRALRLEPTSYGAPNVIGGAPYNQVDPGVVGATVGGGGAAVDPAGTGTAFTNRVSANFGSIGGGAANQVSGAGGTVPGGMFNTANGNLSFAAGNHAKANHDGAFVWADSTAADFASTTPNQFAVRATGGVFFSDNTPSLSFGSSTRQMINLWGTTYGLGVQAYTTYFRCDGLNPGQDGFAWYQGGSHNDNRRNPGGGTELMYLNNAGLTVNGTLLSTSDRNVKTNFTAVNSREVLDKVSALPISSWCYRNDPETRHLGPVAQDFYAFFNIGPDDRHIATVDESGVALAAIQGLNQKLEQVAAAQARLLQEKEVELRELQRQVTELHSAVERLSTR